MTGLGISRISAFFFLTYTTMAHQTDDPTNKARWTAFYPSYIDANKTIAQGRRIPKENVSTPHTAVGEMAPSPSHSCVVVVAQNRALHELPPRIVRLYSYTIHRPRCVAGSAASHLPSCTTLTKEVIVGTDNLAVTSGKGGSSTHHGPTHIPRASTPVL